MNSTTKPTPVVSLPDNWSAFNGYEMLPWDISRAEAAAHCDEFGCCVPVGRRMFALRLSVAIACQALTRSFSRQGGVNWFLSRLRTLVTDRHKPASAEPA